MSTEYPSFERIQGSLAAGAAGDALGYAVEFDTLSEIHRRFGPAGITSFELNADGKACVSDDTQMTLFTAEGLLNAHSRGLDYDLDGIISRLTAAYLQWYATQTMTFTNGQAPSGTLLGNPELWHRRAPGNTCISAMRAIEQRQPVDNTSKGCGGIMRIAPVAIFGASINPKWDEVTTAKVAGKAAFITHHHPLSTLASAIAAVVIRKALDATTPPSTADYAAFASEGLEASLKAFPGIPEYHRQFMRTLIDNTFEAAASSLTDVDVIDSLGHGWVAEETLAIALASVARHPGDIAAALTMAVNHDGDSDSTGAVTGNIIGAALGAGALPSELMAPIDLLDVITTASRRLAALHTPAPRS